MRAVERFLKEDIRLPSPPAIASRIVDLVRRDDFSFRDLAAIIESDPALATKVLRLANSGLYGVARNIVRIETAIGILGVNSLKNIALSFVLAESFKGNGGGRFDFERFSKRAVTAAVAGKLISTEIQLKSDDVFITSLLQDIGIAAMFMCRRDDYSKVLDERLVSQKPLSAIETEFFGFDHQEAGAGLLQMWGLPESVYLPIRYHHQTHDLPAEIHELCNVIQMSDHVAALYCGSSGIRNFHNVKDMLLRTFDLQENRAANLIDSVADNSRTLLAHLDIPPGGIRPVSQILQEANEELARLNLSYDVLIVAYREAREHAERLASKLKAANDNLRNLAFRDELTGLHNYRYFQDALTKELVRAERCGRTFALILFDVDNFKEVNDQHGHLAGDIVLQTVAKEIKRHTRQVDLVTRYGGDEFAVILTETNEKGAMYHAEVCRALIEAAKISVNGRAIPVTISVGVASYDGERRLEKREIMAAADRALYQSKKDGRNRVSLSPPSGPGNVRLPNSVLL